MENLFNAVCFQESVYNIVYVCIQYSVIHTSSDQTKEQTQMKVVFPTPTQKSDVKS